MTGHPPTPLGRTAPARLLDSALQDLRIAMRGLVRRPGFTAAALLTLALGIGANTAVFSVVNALLLRPLPFNQPEALVSVWPGRFLSNREVAYLRAGATGLAEVGSLSPGWLMALTGIEEPARIDAAKVSDNLFGLLGVRPALGRTFGIEAEAPGGPPVVVLSDAAWRTHLGADPAALGRTVVLDGVPHAVIGVMPPEFEVMGIRSDAWVPLPMDPGHWSWAGSITLGIARLAPGATLKAANLELRGLIDRMRGEFGEPDAYGRDARLEGLKETTVGRLRPVLLVLLGAVGFMLLIAASNVANLLLVRAADRQVEFAVRASLGAGRRRIVRQLLTESLLLGTLGGAAGLAVAIIGVRALRAGLPADTPRLAELHVDATVLIACAAAAMVTAILFGLAPALFAARADIQGRLRGDCAATPAGRRTRGALVAAEVALAGVLLAGALLMVRTIAALGGVDPGFQADQVLSLRVQPSAARTVEEQRIYLDEIHGRIAALPGVEAVGSILHLPLSGRSWSSDLRIEGRPLPPGVAPPTTAWQAVGGRYFRAMGVPLLRGRPLAGSDDADAPPVALVNEAFARRYFAGEDPIGRRIRTGRGSAQYGPWMTIVGVVGAVRHDRLAAPPEPEIYLPYTQSPAPINSLVVRTRTEPGTLAVEVRDAIWAVDPDVPIVQVMTLRELVARSIARPRLVRTLLGLFAAVGVVLAMVGIYGVVAYGVRQRTRELGIRMALGARSREAGGLVIRQSIGIVAPGIVIGIACALALTRFLESQLYGVSPTDPLTIGAVSAMLLGSALLASWLPARKAARVDPMEALRAE